MNCKFTVWKNQTKGMFSNVTITLPMAKKLLAGKSVRMKKLLKNDGTTFDADVELKVDKESRTICFCTAETTRKMSEV
jgi:hypothetical protein